VSLCEPARAQEPQDVVRISTSLVQLDIVVTKDAKQVTHLKPEDFEILEDGKPQKITHFAYVSANQPTITTETRSETETIPSLPKPPLPSGFTVRTRAGYYGVTEEPAAGPPSGRDRINKALLSPFAADEVSMRTATQVTQFEVVK
jgi:hypothetical protein